ncbi:LIM/homeobox protein Lhx9 [Daphnia magna]|uniref:LIM/homeobox protein Lhx9 n=1 Tax=Daphnia magna TaxID=35525 RepID=UPI001E1BDE4F|nr:LIM/homeobox protein Lhx9 [Daphnia magna]
MGILQGDSPTPGPAMYWQPYHNEETALRARPSAVTGASLATDGHNNNNNNESTDTKMIQQHQSISNSSSMLEPNFYHHLEQQQRHQLLPVQHLIKEERDESSVTAEDESITSKKAATQELPHETGSTTVEQQRTGTTVTTAAVVCAGCGFKIVDRYYLVAVDKAWHSECLRCDECRRPLDTALSCFARQSRIYCREDYNRLFAGRKQCAKCCETLQPDELVMRGREHLFHTRCFSCHICQTHLIKGSTFGMVGALIFCQQHYQQGTVQSGFGHPGGRDNNNMPIQHPSFPVHNASVEAYMTHHQEPFGSPHHPYDPHGHQHYGQLVHQAKQQQVTSQQQQKTKRLRTSFKHHQLRMLKSYFATNHNPDAKDLKQLSQKTTLSKRVLQVWFQNARAKWRRLVQKTEGGAGANSGVNGGLGNNGNGHNMSSSSSSSSSNCSGSGNETGSPVPSSSASPSHVRQLSSHGHQQQPMMMMASFMEHQQHHHHQQHARLQPHHVMTTSSRMSLYDEISLSGSSSVASVGFPSPL